MNIRGRISKLEDKFIDNIKSVITYKIISLNIVDNILIDLIAIKEQDGKEKEINLAEFEKDGELYADVPGIIINYNFDELSDEDLRRFVELEEDDE
ncbi:MAG: hypothetical protein SA378_05300 [Sedimentibacter sp.]|uniref:hypothetical protein n=1 Tax=Sedimentibacter sp. TaxID=1960295 RepID=UPI002982362C|nr:hypothetical protein [Sedimentibacter sp.]MDW5299538.1 hypothetical protein [Sedimentibacter sp.]